MKKLPKLKNVIDYAHHPEKTKFMDVFFGATSKFCIGTSSGYCIIPMSFGVPLFLTNMLPTEAIFSLDKKDMYLPKILIKNNKKLDFNEYFNPEMQFLCQDQDYYKKNISWKNNTSLELKKSVREFIDLTLNKKSNIKSNNQKKIDNIINTNLNKFGIRNRTSLPNFFLGEYEDLL